MLPLRKRNRLIKTLNRTAQWRSTRKGRGRVDGSGTSAATSGADNSLPSYAIRVINHRNPGSNACSFPIQSALNERYELSNSSRRGVHYRRRDRLNRQQFTCRAPNNTTRFIMDDHLLMDDYNKAVMSSVNSCCYYKDNGISTDMSTDRVFITASVDGFKRHFDESIDEEIENARYRVLFDEYLSMNKLDLAQKCADLQQRILKCEESKEDRQRISSIASISQPLPWAVINTANCSKDNSVTSFGLVFDKEAYLSAACQPDDKKSGNNSSSNGSADDTGQRHRSSTVLTASSVVPTRGGASSRMMIREAIGGPTSDDRCCIDDRH